MRPGSHLEARCRAGRAGGRPGRSARERGRGTAARDTPSAPPPTGPRGGLGRRPGEESGVSGKQGLRPGEQGGTSREEAAPRGPSPPRRPQGGTRTPARRPGHHSTYRATGSLASPRPFLRRARLWSHAPDRCCHWLALARAARGEGQEATPHPPLDAVAHLSPAQSGEGPASCHGPRACSQWFALTLEARAGQRAVR